MTIQEKAQELKKIVDKIKNASSESEKEVYKIEAINIIADIFAPEAIQAVKNIERKPLTTQGHYGEYLHLISGFTGLYRLGFIKALKSAGADHDGINGAISILTI